MRDELNNSRQGSELKRALQSVRATRYVLELETCSNEVETDIGSSEGSQSIV